MDVRVGLKRKLSTEELMLNCCVGEASWESLGLEGDQASQSYRKSILYIHCIEKTDAEAETPILWPPDMKNWFIRKYLGDGKDWRWEDKGMIEDEMVGWHHWLNGHELFEQVPGDGERQGNLACCSPWDLKESDTTEWLNTNSYIGITGTGVILPP